jgi:hypothetical protein
MPFDVTFLHGPRSSRAETHAAQAVHDAADAKELLQIALEAVGPDAPRSHAEPI